MKKSKTHLALQASGYNVTLLPNGEGVTATKGGETYKEPSMFALRKKIFEY